MQLLQHISVQKDFIIFFLNNHNTYVIVVFILTFFLGDLHGVSQVATSIIHYSEGIPGYCIQTTNVCEMAKPTSTH
jgi:hypothetical protein